MVFKKALKTGQKAGPLILTPQREHGGLRLHGRRELWEQEGGGSNPLAPTSLRKITLKYNTLVTLYVLKGETGKRYVGITNDLKRRLKEHRSKRSKGSQVLGEFVVLLTEEYQDHKSARKREKFLKSGQGRKWLDEYDSEPARGG